ncbi:MAG: OsmC family protein [Dehalococcoidales bacterium]|nr:OsmC family protein [Dehalococcoidales bacterium]
MSTMTAKVTLQEKVRWQGEAGSGYTLSIDGSPDHGGEDAGFRAMELMLLSLGGCLGGSMLNILRRMREDVTGYEIHLTGERAEQPPTVYRTIVLEHTITGHKVSEVSVKRALALTEDKYCAAKAVICQTAALTHTIRIVEAT